MIRVGMQNSQFVLRQMNDNNNAVSKALQRLSSGLKINSAADDVSGFSRAEGIKAQLSMLGEQKNAVSDHMDKLDIIEGQLGTQNDILNRMGELATKAANGAMTEQEREAMNAEYQELRKELSNMRPETHGYINGNMKDITIEDKTAKTTDVAFKPLNGTVSLEDKAKQDAERLAAAQENKGEVISPEKRMEKEQDYYGLIDTDLLSAEGANKAMGLTKDASKSVSKLRSQIGAEQNANERQLEKMETSEENLRATLSRIQDADMAKESINYIQSKTLLDGSMLMASHIKADAESTLALLKL